MILAAIIGALGNRVRGGLFPMPGGTQVGRLVGWGIPCGVVAWLCGMSPLAALCVGLGAFVGCMMGQYGGLSMGWKQPAPDVSPWLTMTVWGLVRTIGPIAALMATHRVSPLLLGAGLLCAPIYWVVWTLPPWAFLPGLGRTTNPLNPDPPQLAEAIHGAVMMAALAASV